MAHILFDVSGHGFGHLAQTAAVVGALADLRPDLRLTVRAEHDPRILRRFLPDGVAVALPPPDPVMAMSGPIDVDAAASMDRYRALHADWERTVDGEVVRMAPLRPDLVVSDVGYVSLAAAARLGVPAYAMCSLDWYGIFLAYCGGFEGAGRIAEQILAAYEGAAGFLQVTPHLPMDYFDARRSFGPVARMGRDRRDELEQAFPQIAGRPLVAYSLGGIDGGPTAADLPESDAICWMCDTASHGRAPRVLGLDEAGLSFIDLLATADAVVTKPGYGTIVEAVCNGTAVVSVERSDWPETPYLEAWACGYGQAKFVARTAHWIDDAVAAVGEVLAEPEITPPAPSGNAEVAAFLAGRADTADNG